MEDRNTALSFPSQNTILACNVSQMGALRGHPGWQKDNQFQTLFNPLIMIS